MELDHAINRFRIASRELFNNYFRIDDPYNSNGWDLEEDFSAIEEVMFQKMVVEPFDLPEVTYGHRQPAIAVKPNGDFAPWLLNRQVGEMSGYWDHPIQEFTKDADLEFLGFFDFDQLAFRDNRYVRVFVKAWPANPDAVGRYALVETQYVRYFKV